LTVQLEQYYPVRDIRLKSNFGNCALRIQGQTNPRSRILSNNGEWQLLADFVDLVGHEAAWM